MHFTCVFLLECTRKKCARINTHAVLKWDRCVENWSVCLVQMDITCNNALDQLRCWCDLFFVFFFIDYLKGFSLRSKEKDFHFSSNWTEQILRTPCKILRILTCICGSRVFLGVAVNRCRLCERNTRMVCTLIIWLFSISVKHKRRLRPQTKNPNTQRLKLLQMVNVIDIALGRRQKYEVAAAIELQREPEFMTISICLALFEFQN